MTAGYYDSYRSVKQNSCMALHKGSYSLCHHMGVGRRIDELLKERGLSQSELARRVGVSQPAINALIRGSSRSSTHLHRIARVLRTTPAYLTGETDDPEGDIPEVELSSEEARLLSLYRLMSSEDRRALLRFADAMIGPKTLHTPRLAYRPGDK